MAMRDADGQTRRNILHTTAFGALLAAASTSAQGATLAGAAGSEASAVRVSVTFLSLSQTQSD
jgi:hypothetical protein